jgi:hypothetical protein
MRERPCRGEAGGMNGFLEISTAVALVIMAVFLAAGLALPFLPHEREGRR